MSFFINDAFADTANTAVHQAAHQGSSMSSILMLAAFIVLFIFYFGGRKVKLKAHRQLIENLAQGDEVITSAGILGKIIRIADDFVVLQIAPAVEISIQKSAVTATVPKGTFKN